jgi:acetyl esterase/lipase
MGPRPSVAEAPDAQTARSNFAAMFIQMRAAGLVPTPDYAGVHKETISIPVRDGSSIPALLYRPTEPPSGGSPLMVFHHGGGWTLGVAEMEEKNCLPAVKLGSVAVSLDYRLAPEHVFPTAVEDSWDALKWVSQFYPLPYAYLHGC